jgi:recombination protein RecT
MASNQLAVAKKRELVEVIEGEQYQEKFKALLPPDVDRRKFTSVLVRAVQEDPALMNADKTSLLLACQRAAQDGLIPDKREGALVIRGGKVGWNPMIAGLRKILAEAGYDLRAECVHANDQFDYELGDNPSLSHKPALLGEDRGEMIGAYAVITHLATGAKWREVMNMQQLNAVKAVGAKGGPWSGSFASEMYRKTVGRRCLKQVPITNKRIQEVLERDNENFELPAAGPTSVARAVQAAARGQTAPDAGPDEIEGEFSEPPATEGEGDFEDPL